MPFVEEMALRTAGRWTSMEATARVDASILDVRLSILDVVASYTVCSPRMSSRTCGVTTRSASVLALGTPEERPSFLKVSPRCPMGLCKPFVCDRGFAQAACVGHPNLLIAGRRKPRLRITSEPWPGCCSPATPCSGLLISAPSEVTLVLCIRGRRHLTVMSTGQTLVAAAIILCGSSFERYVERPFRTRRTNGPAVAFPSEIDESGRERGVFPISEHFRPRNVCNSHPDVFVEWPIGGRNTGVRWSVQGLSDGRHGNPAAPCSG